MDFDNAIIDDPRTEQGSPLADPESQKADRDGTQEPRELPAATDLRYWQQRLLDSILRVAVVMGFIAYVPSVWLSLKEGRYAVATIDTLMYALVVYLHRDKRLPYVARAAAVCLSCFTVGLTLLVVLGPFGGGPIWLFAVPIMAAVLVSPRASLVAVAINCLVLVAIGVLIQRGAAGWDVASENAVFKWGVISANFVLLNTFATLSLTTVLGGLQRTIGQERTLGRRLRQQIDATGRAEAKYRALFESSRDAIMTLGPPAWRYTAGNAAAIEMFGARDEQHFTSKSPWEFSPELQPDGRRSEDKAKQMIETAMREGSHFFEWRHQRSDGEEFPATVLLTRVELGDQAFLQATVRDETGRIALETQLRQSQKLEAIGTLAGGVAHDFNNLLMGTMNYVELCRDGLEPDHPIREWLDEITADSQRSANLTRQLLAFARKQTIAPKVLDLNDTVSSMLKLLRRLIGEDIDLAWMPCVDVWPVKLDPSQADQILANLCVNARDAIGGVGKVTIETENVTLDAEYCATHTEAVPGAYVMLAVSDTGCGMDRETLGRVFEPFFTTKGVGDGTGLGLATVYGIVKQNNGSINVYSEPGKGTTFRIYLPRLVGEISDVSEAKANAPRPGGNETILLVEDEKSIRVTAALFLEAFGYTTLAADCPEQALCLAAEHPGRIHLLITDVVMPGMSGRDLATQLASDRPEMKRLFISGFTADVIAHRGILEDGVNFLSKPFDRDALAGKVREVLDT